MKHSAPQLPLLLHTSPVPQLVPAGSSDHSEMECVGVQTRQAFDESTVPAAYSVPPMKQSGVQLPLLQTSPEAQYVPLARFDQAVVELDGVQTRQAFAESTVPAAYSVPPMKQSATQLPLLQTSPVPQLVPLAAAFAPLSVQTTAPVEQETLPVSQTFAGVQLEPVEQAMQSLLVAPVPSQTRLFPQLVPAATGLAGDVSTQTVVPVLQEVTPATQLSALGLVEQALPGVHDWQLPLSQ
jgi:hypothetical protein